MVSSEINIILFSLVINSFAISILSFGLYFKRHRRRELATGYVAFGFSLFVVSLSLSIADSPIGIGIGFGLFAILSIVRLRSDEATWNEIGYTMVSIVIGLVNGLTVINLELKLLFSVVLLMAIYVADHPAILPSSENLRLKFTVDRLIFGKIELEDYLSKVLNAEIKDLIILEIDTVREIMVVDVRIKRVSGEK
jgi:hypothetical protein